jgi:hypothetical protein
MRTRWTAVVDKNWTKESKRGRAHFATKLALPIVIAVVGALVVSSIPGSIPAYCVFDAQYLPAPWLVAAGLASFVGGRFFTRLRKPREGGTLSKRAEHNSGFLGQFAFSVVFVMLAGIWFYEAVGTAHLHSDANGVGGFEPITYYVRCAVYADRSHVGVAPYTLFLVSLICFLIGRWLWSAHKKLPAPTTREVSLS